MAVVRIYPGGTSGGFAGAGLAPGKRGEIKGWSRGAARRMVAWLWSINSSELGTGGWAVTLTVGETPSTSQEWTDARDDFLDRMRRAGMTRYHWVTEWTAIGRPHTHMACYSENVRFDVTALLAWLEVCDSRGWIVNSRAQHIVKITGISGWLQYVAKHAARGVVHYQREGAPEGWAKTGRLWGKGGEWPEEELTEVQMTTPQFDVYRSLIQTWLLGDMELRKVPREFIEATRDRWANPEHGQAQGVSGWIPGHISYTLAMQALSECPSDGYEYSWENPDSNERQNNGSKNQPDS